MRGREPQRYNILFFPFLLLQTSNRSVLRVLGETHGYFGLLVYLTAFLTPRWLVDMSCSYSAFHLNLCGFTIRLQSCVDL